MVTYANLGGLGANEGAPVVHRWEPPPPPPPWILVAGGTALKGVLALLLLLPLFLLRANRCAAAWWIWLPVGLTALAGIPLVCWATGGEDSEKDVFCAFLAGLGAVWLLTPWLTSRYRVVMVFKTLLLLTGFSTVAFVPSLVTGNGRWRDLWPYLVGLLGCGSLVAVLALTLAGFCVRRRFGRVRFLLWLAGWVVLGWAGVVCVFFLSLGGFLRPHSLWGPILTGILVMSGLTAVLLLPPLLLSFCQPFYRARFAAWLNLPQPEASAGAGVPALSLVEVAQVPPR